MRDELPDSAASQVRTQAITMAHENIDRTIENAETILAQFDIVRRVRDCSQSSCFCMMRML